MIFILIYRLTWIWVWTNQKIFVMCGIWVSVFCSNGNKKISLAFCDKQQESSLMKWSEWQLKQMSWRKMNRNWTIQCEGKLFRRELMQLKSFDAIYVPLSIHLMRSTHETRWMCIVKSTKHIYTYKVQCALYKRHRYSDGKRNKLCNCECTLNIPGSHNKCKHFLLYSLILLSLSLCLILFLVI